MTYGDRVGSWLPSGGTRRDSARRAPRDTVGSASVTRERSALRASSRDYTVGVRERSGTGRVRADSATRCAAATPRCAAHPRMDAANVGSAPQAGGGQELGAFPHNRTRTSRFCLMHRQVEPMTSKRIGSAPCRRSLSTLGKLNPAALAGFFCGTPFEWMMAMRPRRSFGRTGMPGMRGRSWRMDRQKPQSFVCSLAPTQLSMAH